MADSTNDDIEIISEEILPVQNQQNSSLMRRRRRLHRPHQVINVDELPSSDEDDVEIVEVRNLSPLPPPPQPPLQEQEHVLHAPGRTFPIGRLHLRPQRSFPNTRSATALLTRIRTPGEMERSYQQRRMNERRRALEIRNRFYRENNNNNSQINQRIWGMLPRDLSLGLGNFLFPGNMNNLIFRDDSETDDDYQPGAGADLEERETEFWINRIQQLENLENEARVSKRMKFSESFKKKLLSNSCTPSQQQHNYFNSVKEDKQPSCIQCGVELGEGVPDNHSKSKKSLIELIKLKKSPAPFEYFDKFDESDILNSKKIFFSKNCGHLYCGRCIRSFSKLNNKNKLKKKKILVGEKDDEFFEIYDNNEPILNLRKCCGYQCNANLHKFYEVYF